MGFKKGHPQFNTGRTRIKRGQRLSPETEFKKGQIPFAKLHPELMPRGEKHHNWKGGQFKRNGYIFIYMPNHPFAIKDGHIKRAVLVMEKHLNRYLKKGEIIHHKGIKYPINSIKNRQDDRIENFMLFKNGGEHIRFHNLNRRK